jgi:hypothetical protein
MAEVPSNTREAQQPEKPGNVSPVVVIYVKFFDNA